jgi:Flp pilus assembly protein TadB
MTRPFQYSLRTIFILVLLAAAFFGGMAVQRRETEQVRRIAEQERALAEAERERALVSEQQARVVADQLHAELARAQSKVENPATAESTDGQ